MPSPKITLYMDIVSPFAYLAFHVLRVSMNQYSERGLATDQTALFYVCQVQCQIRAHLPRRSHEDLREQPTDQHQE